MYKFIQKNQKKFLAVFGVGLMIVFVLPQVAFDRQKGTALEVIATVGDEPIHLGEARDAKEQWGTIENIIPPQILPQVLGPVIFVAREIKKDPELFVLLQREAQQMGLRVPEERARELVTVLAQVLELRGQSLPNPSTVIVAMRNLMLVQALFERVSESIKLSEPVVMREIAANVQQVKLDMVHWTTADFEKDIPAPTPEQLQKQFNDFKNLPPGAATERNPFGFGYLMPSRVKLQYLTIPRDEITRAVRTSKSEFQWKVDAMLRYRTNPSRYVSTQPSPATLPASQPATTRGTTQPATQAASGPTTRPFAEVHEDIVKELMAPEVDRKVDEIAASLADRMAADFEAYQRKTSTTAADFGTRQYIERIAADVEKRNGVKLGISEINDPKDDKGLTELKGIGQSMAGEMPFPRYVLQFAEPLLPAGKTSDEALSLDEPSRRLRDPEGNVYIFQIKDAEPAHAPANLDAVKEKVTEDVRKKLAFDAAVAAAKKLHEQAASSGLESAAKGAGKDVFTTPGFIDRQGNIDGASVPLVPHVDLPAASRQKLVTQAFELLTQATPDKAHPARVVELHDAGRVVVAELAEVERPWPDSQEDFLKYQVSQRLVMQRAERVLSEYFRTDNVKQRLNYKSKTEKPAESAAAN